MSHGVEMAVGVLNTERSEMIQSVTWLAGIGTLTREEPAVQIVASFGPIYLDAPREPWGSLSTELHMIIIEAKTWVLMGHLNNSVEIFVKFALSVGVDLTNDIFILSESLDEFLNGQFFV